MNLRVPHAALALTLLASACAVVTGIDGYSVGEPSASSSSSGNLPDGGPLNVVPTPPDGGSLPPTCSSGQVACESSTTAASCENGTWKRTACPETCTNGACDSYPSCRNAAGANCGASPLSCCAPMPVPGGTFHRRNDATLPAMIGPFELDVFEVTVGRFRAFIESGGATQAHAPTAGTGAHPKLPGSGWHDEWDLRLPQDIGQLTSSLNGGKSTWTDAVGANEHLPINNVQWLQAFAFCAWDGGRLPTYAELSFAATGGDEQRLYPWGSAVPSGSVAAVQAAFNCNFKLPVRTCTTAGCGGCDLADIAPVGSLPAGAGRFGQLDLAGNVAEFALDLSDPPEEALPPPVCNDCAVVLTTDPNKAMLGTKQFAAQFYSLGGAWDDGNGASLATTSWNRRKYDERQDSQGFRCARNARVLP